MALTHETRRALAERVQRRVEGRGISRHAIEDAISRVADALDRQPLPAWTGESRSDAAPRAIVAIFTAPSAPDLGSRVRSALQAESVTPLAIGTGTSGRHTVATVRLAADARSGAERAAARVSASISFVSDPSSLLSSK